MKCETVKVKCDNEQGFYIVNADAVPNGAVIYGQEEKKRGRPAKGK